MNQYQIEVMWRGEFTSLRFSRPFDNLGDAKRIANKFLELGNVKKCQIVDVSGNVVVKLKNRKLRKIPQQKHQIEIMKLFRICC